MFIDRYPQRFFLRSEERHNDRISLLTLPLFRTEPEVLRGRGL